jgi:hypothetical protein
LTGVVVAGIFVVTGSGGRADEMRAASKIYAADLIGGCVGAVAGSLWLIPFLGMLSTAVAMVGVSMVAAVLLRS